MYSNFETINDDRKKLILDACIHEFAERGYEQASTNVMIREAGISKGILFHYFKSKKGLFLYIVEYALRTLVEEYNKYSFQTTGDIFRRLSELSIIKLKINQTYPKLSKLLVDALANSPEDIHAEVERRYNQISQEYLPLFFQDIDYTKFRSGVDPAKAIEIIMLFIEALGNKYMKECQSIKNDWLENYDQLLAEYNSYMEILKYGMYSN
ncbi:TetR/AcrR family transcriptional regulator [Desulfosporosinus sp. SB140]|uniref:TetR/AcrR family transcriptional regulator n=1 Tax=Desulfosporosinus paludis TaxID=3115649 RepID=UPI00388D18B3